MATTSELDELYMGTAIAHSKLSKANRLKVGACLVTTNDVMLGGFNGTPSGWNNQCELGDVTKPTVIHAELNTILKAAKEGISVVGATMYITHAPCQQCSAMMAQAGIKRVVYREEYRDLLGVYFLSQNKVDVKKLEVVL